MGGGRGGKINPICPPARLTATIRQILFAHASPPLDGCLSVTLVKLAPGLHYRRPPARLPARLNHALDDNEAAFWRRQCRKRRPPPKQTATPNPGGRRRFVGNKPRHNVKAIKCRNIAIVVWLRFGRRFIARGRIWYLFLFGELILVYPERDRMRCPAANAFFVCRSLASFARRLLAASHTHTSASGAPGRAAPATGKFWTNQTKPNRPAPKVELVSPAPALFARARVLNKTRARWPLASPAAHLGGES